jgi:hypothetical protein
MLDDLAKCADAHRFTQCVGDVVVRSEHDKPLALCDAHYQEILEFIGER